MKTFGTEWKKTIRDGTFIHAGHIFLPSAALGEAMAAYGLKYIWVDGEHGAFDKDAILAHITAINGAGAGVFVRVTSGDPATIKPVLEMGPDGIIIPMVNTAEEARRVVAACRYPPKGTRGFGPRRANRYGVVEDPEYIASIDEALVKFIQVEHREAVDNLDDILGVDGIDGVIIGPYDLSGSMGLLGQLRHPDMLAQYQRIVACCKAHKMPCGPSIAPSNPDWVKYWLDLKVDYLFCGDELTYVRRGIDDTKALIARLRAS
ncbi:MAG: hypothetical protein LBR29_00300 [Methylobacteriaceae bacterium]|jgi:2-keto-3-deoxy-L-rhamnonate aldolase RhmA|nr:hypothetical protein [Methylobacteriaceae bacterium]